MDLNDKEMRQFVELIFKEVDKKIANATFIKSYSATVVNVGTGTADVQLAGTTTTITGLKNKTGETLVANDEVYLHSPTNNLTNLYIAIKK